MSLLEQAALGRLTPDQRERARELARESVHPLVEAARMVLEEDSASLAKLINTASPTLQALEMARRQEPRIRSAEHPWKPWVIEYVWEPKGQLVRECAACMRAPTHYFSKREPREHVLVCKGCYLVERGSSWVVVRSTWNRRNRKAKHDAR